MTKKQAAFITTYFNAPDIRHGLYNGAAAARTAGYSKRTARQMAYKLRRLPAFKEAEAEFCRQIETEWQHRLAKAATPLIPARWR